ncbi:MAG: hypothetical protein WC943_17105, partial [Elusimicrobiota bacterium]
MRRALALFLCLALLDAAAGPDLLAAASGYRHPVPPASSAGPEDPVAALAGALSDALASAHGP